jgi:hypothetical protein
MREVAVWLVDNAGYKRWPLTRRRLDALSGDQRWASPRASKVELQLLEWVRLLASR